MKTKEIILIILRHILRIAVMLIILAALYFVWRCPSKLIFGLPCPGCGMTRAAVSLLRLDFKSAFYYHPLVFIMPPVFLYIIHIRVIKHRLSKKTEITLLIVVILLFAAVYFYRLYTGNEIVKPRFEESLIYYILNRR